MFSFVGIDIKVRKPDCGNGHVPAIDLKCAIDSAQRNFNCGKSGKSVKSVASHETYVSINNL